jgi:hypothetical protein
LKLRRGGIFDRHSPGSSLLWNSYQEKAGDMRKLIIAVTMIALLPASANAQDSKGPPSARTDKQRKEDAAIEKAYLEANKRAGSAPAVKSDPWQAVRPAGDDSKTR